MKKFLLWFLLLTIISLYSIAQQKARCYTNEYTQLLEASQIHYANGRKQLDREASTWLDKNKYKAAAAVTIPVVVHVLYNTDEQNISDAQIQSQIVVLNEDFGRKNADRLKTPAAFSAVAANCDIQFCLASIDPDGNPTTGITRTFTSQTQIGSLTGTAFYQTAQGGHDIWDRNSYLNIWVCQTADDVLGFASPPSLGSNSSRDGIVIGWQYFGFGGIAFAPNDRGRTTTHEVGHWLGLEHIWGSGSSGGSYCGIDDNISDTPNQEDANYFCPSFPHVSCINGPAGDMFMNYMDYTDDACMNLFTEGQKDRMMAILNTSPRKSILSSTAGCSFTGISAKNDAPWTSISPNPSNGLVHIQSSAIASGPWRITIYDILGKQLEHLYFPSSMKEVHLPLSLKPGIYPITIERENHYAVEKLLIQH
jgi:hypothetical protein